MKRFLNKKTAIIIAAVSAVIAALVLVLFLVIIPNINNAPKDEASANANGPYALLAPKPQDDADFMTLHGFLDAANAQAMPVKLYNYAEGEALDSVNSALESAKEDGSSAFVLVYDGQYDIGAIQQRLSEAKMPYVFLYSDTGDSSISINYASMYDEAALLTLEALDNNTGSKDENEAADNSKGTVIIYGENEDVDKTALIQAFETQLSDKYTVESADTADNLKNASAIFALSDEKTVMEALGGSDKKPVVIAYGLSDDTRECFDKGLYSVCTAPYFDAGAVAFDTINALKNGETVSGQALLNCRFEDMSGAQRLISERYRALLFFGAATQTPAPTLLTVPPTQDPNASAAPTASPEASSD